MEWQKYFILVIFIIISGCAYTGPGPIDKNYNEAIETIPGAKDAVFSLPASWYPNTMVGDFNSLVNSASILGKLFVTQERLIFAVYDKPTNNYLQSYEVAFSNIDWITGKKHSLSRFIRFQSNNTVHSFGFGAKGEGENISFTKDEVMAYIIDKVEAISTP